MTVAIGGSSSEYLPAVARVYSFERSRGFGPRRLRRPFRKKNTTTPMIASRPSTPPTAPPMIGPMFDFSEGAEVSVAEAPALAVREGVSEDVVSVSFRVVDAQCVNVLLFVAAKSFSIVPFVYVLANACMSETLYNACSRVNLLVPRGKETRSEFRSCERTERVDPRQVEHAPRASGPKQTV